MNKNNGTRLVFILILISTLAIFAKNNLTSRIASISEDDSFEEALINTKEKSQLTSSNEQQVVDSDKIETLKGKNTLASNDKKQSEITEKSNRIEDKRILSLSETGVADIELNFENVSLKNVLDYIEELFNVKFIPDDVVKVEGKQSKSLSDIKITFRTHKVLHKQQVWALVDLFLDMANLARTPMPGGPANFYRIMPTTAASPNADTANKAPLPTYIGVDTQALPNSGRIRYVYFLSENTTTDQIKTIIDKLKSPSAIFDVLKDLNAFIITDDAYNIKSLMNIVKELDATGIPEVLSVLRLKNADAADVVKLYESLKGKDDPFKLPYGAKKQPTSFYFPQEARIIAEPRTNVLIILGPKEAVHRIEDFIIKHVDVSLRRPSAMLHRYQLNYAPAEQLAKILNDVTRFGADSEAAKFGGVRGGEKYLNRLYFEAETQTNSLIIRGPIEDYNLIIPTIQQLDRRQPQVAMEILLVAIEIDKDRRIQSQTRNKFPSRINAQTSGFFDNPIQINQNGGLITNLLSLASSAIPGTTVLSLGKESVWSLIGILQETSQAELIANPFLIATNKYKASVKLGETRRIATSTVVSGDNTQFTEGDISANLEVHFIPQINDYGIINLDIQVKLDEFTTTAADVGNTINRTVQTNANVADGEVLVLGGIIRNRTSSTITRVPILADIPFIGPLLFQNKSKTQNKTNLLIFMAPKIIHPDNKFSSEYTQRKAYIARKQLNDIRNDIGQSEPLQKVFFKDATKDSIDMLKYFVPEVKDGYLEVKEKEELIIK